MPGEHLRLTVMVNLLIGETILLSDNKRGSVLPNFLVIGSQKAGTTSLYNILSKHPEIYMPQKKEVNFFFLEKEFLRGIGYYERFFFTGIPPGAKAFGEASPGYICHPQTPTRIKEYLPKARLILIVRNPIDRAYSQYWDNRMTLSETQTFEGTLDIALVDTYEPGKLGYFSRGTYIKYIRRYLDLFDADQLLVLLFNDLRDDPVKFYQHCFQFLGVDPGFRCPEMEAVYNPSFVWDNFLYRWFFNRPAYGRYIPARLKRLLFWGRKKRFQYPPICQAAKERLVRFYEPWNRELAAYLGRDLSHWDE